MTPDELRRLAEEWAEQVERGGGAIAIQMHALAPDLARLCAEMGEALARYVDPVLTPALLQVDEQARASLAKLSELEV